MDGTTTYSCDTLVAGLVLQSTPVDWWCLYWIHGDTDPSIYNAFDMKFNKILKQTLQYSFTEQELVDLENNIISYVQEYEK